MSHWIFCCFLGAWELRLQPSLPCPSSFNKRINTLWTCLQKYFLTSKFYLVTNLFFSNSTHKTKIRIASKWGDYWIANQLDQSDYLVNQKLGWFDCVFIRLFWSSSRALKSCTLFQGPSTLPLDWFIGLDWWTTSKCWCRSPVVLNMWVRAWRKIFFPIPSLVIL
jgi:hypothetical protein